MLTPVATQHASARCYFQHNAFSSRHSFSKGNMHGVACTSKLQASDEASEPRP
jgi:hypothetical protein